MLSVPMTRGTLRHWCVHVQGKLYLHRLSLLCPLSPQSPSNEAKVGRRSFQLVDHVACTNFSCLCLHSNVIAKSFLLNLETDMYDAQLLIRLGLPELLLRQAIAQGKE